MSEHAKHFSNTFQIFNLNKKIPQQRPLLHKPHLHVMR